MRGLQPELVARTGRRFSSQHRLFNEQSPIKPIKLNFKVREAYTEHVANLDPSRTIPLGVHNEELTTGTIFKPDADDVELTNFSKGY